MVQLIFDMENVLPTKEVEDEDLNTEVETTVPVTQEK